jgi:hypothetical protein
MVRVQQFGNIPVEPLGNKDWVSVFKTASEILDECNVEWQIGGGTLLGFYRDGDVIPHDTDLDVEVFFDTHHVEKTVDTLTYKFFQRGFRLVRTQHNDGKTPMQVAFVHHETNIIVDIYCYYWDCASGEYVNYNEHGLLMRPTSSVKDTEDFFVESLLDTVKIPAEVEQYLLFRYGVDWETPKKSKANWTDDVGDALQ